MNDLWYQGCPVHGQAEQEVDGATADDHLPSDAGGLGRHLESSLHFTTVVASDKNLSVLFSIVILAWINTLM